MNYYELLGISPHASRDQIRAAYLRLAREVHPDRHVGTGEHESAERDKFKQIQQAYEVLSDQEKRQAYDLQHGAIPQRRERQPQQVPTAPTYQGPTRTAPGVRRDIPDDWVRGSRRPVRALTLFRLIATAITIAILVSAIPRCGQYLESELTNSLPQDETPQADVQSFDELVGSIPLIITNPTLDFEFESDAVPFETENATIASTSVPRQPMTMAEFAMLQAGNMNEPADPEFSYPGILASQDGNSLPAAWESPTGPLPSTPAPAPKVSSVPEQADWHSPQSQTDRLLGGRAPSYSSQFQGGTQPGIGITPLYAPPQLGSEAMRRVPSLSPAPPQTGTHRYDNLLPDKQRLPSNSSSIGDPYKARMGSAYAAPPAVDSYRSRPSLSGSSEFGYGNELSPSVPMTSSRGFGASGNPPLYGTSLDNRSSSGTGRSNTSPY